MGSLEDTLFFLNSNKISLLLSFSAGLGTPEGDVFFTPFGFAGFLCADVGSLLEGEVDLDTLRSCVDVYCCTYEVCGRGLAL